MLYNNLSSYFRQKYGQRLKKICVDGGFSCPNRDGRISYGGCIYCGERGAGEHIRKHNVSIAEQVSAVIKNADKNDKFVVYFQNFSNTYAPCDILKARYEAALIDDRIVALAIGTRADCIDEEKAKLIASFAERVDVWVELGLQTSNDNTAKIINRGYPRKVFEDAVKVLNGYGVDVVAHMIIGLPGENRTDAVNTARYLSSLDIKGVKIHSIYVMEGTRLSEMYREKLYTPPSLSEYSDICAECIGNLRKDIILHRITGDCPKDLLVAPEWNKDKSRIIEKINEAMLAREIRQGSLL